MNMQETNIKHIWNIFKEWIAEIKRKIDTKILIVNLFIKLRVIYFLNEDGYNLHHQNYFRNLINKS